MCLPLQLHDLIESGGERGKKKRKSTAKKPLSKPARVDQQFAPAVCPEQTGQCLMERARIIPHNKQPSCAKTLPIICIEHQCSKILCQGRET